MTFTRFFRRVVEEALVVPEGVLEAAGGVRAMKFNVPRCRSAGGHGSRWSRSGHARQSGAATRSAAISAARGRVSSGWEMTKETPQGRGLRVSMGFRSGYSPEAWLTTLFASGNARQLLELIVRDQLRKLAFWTRFRKSRSR